jgi:hypothetical protein
MRGSENVEPPSGVTPMRLYASVKYALSAASARSHAIMRLMPNPATAPRTEPTTGFGMRRRLRMSACTSWMKPSNWMRFSAGARPSLSALNHFRSPPAMK